MSDQQESPAQQPAAQPQVVYVEKKPEKKRPSCLSMIGGTVVLIVVLAVIGSLASKGPTTNTNDASKSSSGSGNSATSPTPTPVPVRQVQGTAATLGAGTFAGGKDVADGLYDVTPGAGESGNFIVTGTDEANDVLGSAGGLGVSKVRARISEGDSIQISSLSRVTFTPVTAPFVTDYKPATLYAGTFTVGQDIGAGRYVATPGSGESGNFIVSGNDSVDEILGSAGGLGVPSVTCNLTDGDVISISSLSQVSLVPSN